MWNFSTDVLAFATLLASIALPCAVLPKALDTDAAAAATALETALPAAVRSEIMRDELCALCGRPLTPNQEIADRNVDGEIRRVHRSCQ